MLGQKLEADEETLTWYGHGWGRRHHTVLALLVLKTDERPSELVLQQVA